MNNERVMLLLMPRPGQTGTGGQAVRTLLVADLEQAGCRLEFLDPEDPRFHGLGRSLPGRLLQRLRFYLEVVRVARRIKATDTVFDFYHFLRLWPVPWLLKFLRTGGRCRGIVQSPEKWLAGNQIERRFAPWFYVGTGRKLRWNRRLARWTARGCCQVVAAGPWMRSFLLHTVGIQKTRITVFGPGCGLVEQPDASRIEEQDMQPTPPPAEPPTAPIVGVGYVDPAKGPHRLLEALALIEAPEIRIDWLGDDRNHNPDYAAWCRQRMNELSLGNRFRFMGRLERSDMNHRYAGARILVSGAPHEGYGLNHLEALTHGLIIIGPKNSTSEEFAPSTSPQALYDPDDPASLAESLKWAIAQIAERRGDGPDDTILARHLQLPRLADCLLGRVPTEPEPHSPT